MADEAGEESEGGELGSLEDLSIEITQLANLETLEQSAVRSVEIARVPEAASKASSLAPAAASAIQAVGELDMAVVKFPPGVGWEDLCVRKRDGWNLLSNFRGDKFNEMAGIKRAGLQSAAIANFALQGAALVVGQAYMTEISDQLKSLEKGVAEIQKAMENEHDAELKAAYDSLWRLSARKDEYLGNPDKRQVALQIIEDATEEASRAWNYQLLTMSDQADALDREKKLPLDELRSEVGRFRAIESRAAMALQLVEAALRVSCAYCFTQEHRNCLSAARECVRALARRGRHSEGRPAKNRRHEFGYCP